MPCPKRILVVDDEPIVCDAMTMLLSHDGHQIVQAHGGTEALAELEATHFDLVFTDFKMPRMNGAELARAIHEKYPDKPVVMVTAFPPKSLPSQVTVVLVKPLNWQSIREAIAQVTGTS